MAWQDTLCILFDGPLNSNGYGSYMGKNAHRVAYELFKGQVPAFYVIDHLCRNRACINIDHLEAVTHGENTRRGKGAAGLNFQKTHCKNGHPFSGDNLIVMHHGGRDCVQCRRERSKKKGMK